MTLISLFFESLGKTIIPITASNNKWIAELKSQSCVINVTTSYIYELERHQKDIAVAKRYNFEQLQAIVKSHSDDLELQNQSYTFSLSEAEKKNLPLPLPFRFTKVLWMFLCSLEISVEKTDKNCIALSSCIN